MLFLPRDGLPAPVAHLPRCLFLGGFLGSGRAPYGPSFSGTTPQVVPHLGGAEKRAEPSRPLSLEGQTRGRLVDAAVKASRTQSVPPPWSNELPSLLEGYNL